MVNRDFLIEPHLENTANEFRQENKSWPVDLIRLIAFSLPLTVEEIPELNLSDIEHWLASRVRAYRFPCSNRQLHGCLIVDEGTGFVFIDSNDTDAEKRFTLAHEVAHFLNDYFLPRQRVVRNLGEGILDVLDGKRQPTVDERLNSIILDVPLKTYMHLFEHDGSGNFMNNTNWKAENKADRLGLEIMAPAKMVCDDLILTGAIRDYSHCFKEAQKLLGKKYGLPVWCINNYARRIANCLTGNESFFKRWGIM